MARTTDRDIKQAERILNAYLDDAGSPVRFRAEGRYGYIGIDEYAIDQKSDKEYMRTRGSMRRTTRTGLTKGDALMCLESMIAALQAATVRNV